MIKFYARVKCRMNILILCCLLAGIVNCGGGGGSSTGGECCKIESILNTELAYIPIILRDFVGTGRNNKGNTAWEHPDFENINQNAKNMVKTSLDADRKPVWGTNTIHLHSEKNFKLWYRDNEDRSTPSPINLRVDSVLPLIKTAEGVYSYTDSQFFPFDNKSSVSYELYPRPRIKTSLVLEGYEKIVYDSGYTKLDLNYGFTTEINLKFLYKGGEQITIRGDDDIWVFINNRLAIDLGGCHNPLTDSVTINTDGKINGSDYGLEIGKIYTIDIFHAERHTFGSNYNLTFKGVDIQVNVCADDCNGTCSCQTANSCICNK